jgi:hypothetical protein
MKKQFKNLLYLTLGVVCLVFQSPIFSVTNSLDYGFYWFSVNGQKTDAVNLSGSAIAVGTTFYDPSKPTVFYFHGWQKGTSVQNYSRETFTYNDPVTKTNVDKTYTIKYPPKTLGNCKQVIGFTGTLGSSTIK